MDKKLSFYDPLFETINFEREFARIDPLARIFKKDTGAVFGELLNSYEMSRLLFIGQAGLNFLEFPSATHNRFSHSIGCWYLGARALESIAVYDKPFGKVRKRGLKDWLDPHGKVFEFLAALLLHDCGHAPFSHVLESTPHLELDHANIAGQLITGEGQYANTAKKKAKGLPTIHSILSKYAMDVKFINALICSTTEQFKLDYPDYVGLKELIDDRIDIDRIDHYCRDSKSMGIKLGEFNIQALLENLILQPAEPEPIMIRAGGIPHILNIIYSRELIWEIALDCPSVRAYEVMLNSAVSLAIDEGEISKEGLPFYTDGELLYRLQSSESKVVRELIYRLFCRKPYEFLGKNEVPEKMTRGQVEEKMSQVRKGKQGHDILVHIPFKDKPKGPDFWLHILTEDGKELADKHPGFNRALWERDVIRNKTIRFFVRDKDTYEELKQAVKDNFPLH